MFCKGGISEAEGASLGTFKDWGTHRVWKPCLEHTAEYVVTAILRMSFKHPSLSAPPYLTSHQPQNTHYCFLSSRQVTLVTVQFSVSVHWHFPAQTVALLDRTHLYLPGTHHSV